MVQDIVEAAKSSNDGGSFYNDQARTAIGYRRRRRFESNGSLGYTSSGTHRLSTYKNRPQVTM